MQVGQCLCQVATHAVLTILEGIDGKQRDVFQCHTVGTLQEDAQLGMLQRQGRRQRQRILFPVCRGDIQRLFGKLLTLVHRVLVNQLHADGAIALGSLCPDRKTVLLAFLHTNAEVALVGQTRATVLVVGDAQLHIMRTACKGTVVLHVDTSEGLPAHQVLRKFERTVLDELAIESAVGSVVDVFKEDAVHGRLNGCSQFLGVDVHDALGGRS